jgi:tetratricopeptide (TPR) repeat protein
MTSRSRARSAFVLTAIVALTLGGATAAHADAEDEARARVKRGLALYDEGEYRLALAELERAYEIAPSYKLLYNLGQIHIQLGEYARAQRTLRRYLEDGKDEIPAERRAEVEKDLQMLAARVAVVTIEVNVPDAEVFVNDRPAGRGAIAKTPVDAGSVRIVVTKPGYESQTRAMSVAGGDETVVRVELAPMKRDVIVVDQGGVPTVAVASWIVTGVLAAGAVGMGIGANAAYSSFEDQRASPISGSAEQAQVDLDKQGNLADALALTTDILIGSAIVAGGISLWLTVRGKPKPGAPAGLRFTW